jgi:hypothetical protein
VPKPKRPIRRCFEDKGGVSKGSTEGTTPLEGVFLSFLLEGVFLFFFSLEVSELFFVSPPVFLAFLTEERMPRSVASIEWASKRCWRRVDVEPEEWKAYRLEQKLHWRGCVSDESSIVKPFQTLLRLRARLRGVEEELAIESREREKKGKWEKEKSFRISGGESS